MVTNLRFLAAGSDSYFETAVVRDPNAWGEPDFHTASRDSGPDSNEIAAKGGFCGALD
jgi:hypothetical protein